jgi:hypothetical protein
MSFGVTGFDQLPVQLVGYDNRSACVPSELRSRRCRVRQLRAQLGHPDVVVASRKADMGRSVPSVAVAPVAGLPQAKE